METLTEENILNYIDTIPVVKNIFNHNLVHVKEMGDGNLNFIFRLKDGFGHSIILKHAPPYLRLLGPTFLLPQTRIHAEMHTMSYFESFAPEYVPHIYYGDEQNFMLFMEDLEGYDTLQKRQLAMPISLHVYEKLGDFLGKVYAHTPPLKNPHYYENVTLKSISENYIFRFPHIPNHEALDIPPFFKPLPKNDDFYKGIEILVNLFLNAKETLIHGDLHTGSVMVKEDKIAIIDAEFSFFGPLGFDMGNLFAHIIFGEIYALFEGKRVQWRDAIGAVWKSFGHDEAVLQTSVGFCGAELYRRLVVPAKAKPLEAITCQHQKEEAYHMVDALAIDLVSNFYHIKRIEDFYTIIERYVCTKMH